MEEEELKYILHLLEDLTEDLYEEIIQIYYDIIECKTCKDLSPNVIEFFRKNLKSNPVTISTLITFFQKHFIDNKTNICKIQELYLEIFNELIDINYTERLLSLISLVKIEDEFLQAFIEKVLKPLSNNAFRQCRKQILTSLMTHQRPEVLRICTEFMQENDPNNEFKLTPEYMLELCYLEKTHWLLKAAQVYKLQLHDMKNVTFKINNFTKQILIIVLIDLVNSQDSSDFSSLINQLTNILSILDNYVSYDKQLQFYVLEIKRELTIVKFCLENNCKLIAMSVFNQVLAQSALSVISQLCKLSTVDRYKISRLLSVNSDIVNELSALTVHPSIPSQKCADLNWDILTYNSYCAITTIIDTIMDSARSQENSHDVSPSLEEVKRLVLSLQPLSYCIEIIENMFSCLFLRYEYFSCDEHKQEFPCGAHSDCSYFHSRKCKMSNKNKNTTSGFICNALNTQLILNTLKCCLESLEDRMQNVEVDPNVLIRVKEMVKIVNHSIWKLQLVSALSPETYSPQLKLCMDYVEVTGSSEDEENDSESRSLKRKQKIRRRHTNPKSEHDQMMTSSVMSMSEDSYSTSPVNNIEFISLMLARPTCLVALALYHSDFSKATQIVEMFDLSDAEIATEVTFTEQLRNLVAKIKNIIYYRDSQMYPTKELSALSVVSTEVMGLVEGFLSSSRSPNSVDVMELASRHPHLQLYNHQNAPLVNAVDILLSSGLNREITYGLINVVERKLAVVRSGTDVVSVKKSNYIRFVEDLASVTFEILGNTEKSFDFVDDVCGIIADCRVPIKHKEFCKLNQLAKDLRKCCDDLEVVVDPKKSATLDQSTLQKYHQTYMNMVAVSDKDLCNVSEVHTYGTKKARIHYLRLCYMYCKSVAQLELDDDTASNGSNTDTPYFSVLDRHLHEIFGKLIYDKGVNVASLEPICKKLNINLIHKLILNFCPPIPLANPSREAIEINFNNLLQAVYDFKNTEENLFLEPTADLAPLPARAAAAQHPHSVTYIVLQNWVLAHIVKKIHVSSVENSLQQSMDARTKYINNYMDLERFNYMKILFGGNRYLASLHTMIDLDKLFVFLKKLIEGGKILKCLHTIDALSEHQLLRSTNLMNLRDLILFKLALHSQVESNWKYCEHLKCPELKVNLVLNNLGSWPYEGAMEVLDYLRFILDPVSSDEGLYEKAKDWMVKIPMYDQISSIMGLSSWYDVHEKSMECPEEIVESLMDNQQFKLCLEWADEHNVSEHMKTLIVVNLLRQMFEYTNQATPLCVRQLLTRLPASQAIDLIQNEMNKIRNVEILQVCVDYISENSSDWKTFENIKVGLQIMLEIDVNLRHLFWDLIEKPLLMIEQFLMNAKLDLLSEILNKISYNLKKDPSGDNLYYNMKSIESVIISRNAIDALLRFYAEKALDMRNPRNVYTPPPKPNDDFLLQSIDSINIEASRFFVMPEKVPTKDQWVHDYATDKCMVCRTSIFSMIIRRHHCRRCGRLVCHACSRHRMQVATYPSGVKFRVCDDCYTQTMSKKTTNDHNPMTMSSNSDSTGTGVTCMDWCLSNNGKKNEAVRTEFSFEFTPNVTLCLSIMRMHSINLDYPRFLLDRSDEISREASGGAARLLVRARRSLLLAAAELYSRAPQHAYENGVEGRAARVAETGAAHAARCLAHADAMATLVKHACHHLMPQQAAHPSHIVRSLLEAEKWELALEIATKSGLPRNSVLAAWGKACLKAGCYKQAREKFALCFKNYVQPMFTESSEECEYGKEASEVSPFVNRRVRSLRCSDRSSSVSSVQSDGRPRTNPPLLNEIIGILQDLNYPVNQQLLNKAENIKTTNENLTLLNTNKKKITLTEPALNIMHTLASVKKIKQGDYSDFHVATQTKKQRSQGLLRRINTSAEPKTDPEYKKLDPFFYRECVYYLTNYGSHVANISFYMNHSNLTDVLKYCYDNLVDRDTFTESVYMECLKKNKVNDLVRCMTDMDSTLEMWADYITHTCRTLEANGRLDALYSLQCATGQNARAAATCARLYSRPVGGGLPPHAAVVARQHHLAAATHHLMQCVPVVTKSNTKSIHLQLDKATIDKHLTTINRQIELAKYLAACEANNRLTDKMMSEIMPVPGTESRNKEYRPLTLFGSNTDRMRLAALVLASGQSIEEGFSLAFKIITENKLDSMKIYMHVARYLVQTDRFMEVKSLAKCVRASKETAASLMSDQILEVGVSAVVARCEARGQLHDEQAELLIHDIHSISIKISCYLECRILPTAYIIAVRHERTNDLRRILHEAERLGNEQVRNACLKRLAKNVL